MKKKKQAKSEEDSSLGKSSLQDFYGLLDKLLPQGRELLREVLEEKQERLQGIRGEEKDELKYALEEEREKNSAWGEYANILFAQYQRVAADYDNLEKRTARRIADEVAYEKEAVIKTLLPALDSFEHTLANSEKAESAQVLARGVRIVYDQILGVLRSHGVEQITAVGEMFDPAVHEAMQRRAESDKPDGVVLEEYQKGYRLGERLIRASRVVVNKVSEAEPASEQEAAQSTEVETPEDMGDDEVSG